MPLSRAADLLQLLERWVERGWLRALDKAFVGFLHELDPQADPLVLLAAALDQPSTGPRPCVPGPVRNPQGAGLCPVVAARRRPASWRHAAAVAIARRPRRRALVPGAGCQSAWSRWRWMAASCGAAAALGAVRASACTCAVTGPTSGASTRRLRLRLATQEAVAADLAAALERLVRPSRRPMALIDWQKLACALATRGAFSIITGGPGTGKTTTVVRLLALLQAPAVEAGNPLRIRLAAPTGKAAARLTESISQQVLSPESGRKRAAKNPDRGHHRAPPAGQPSGHPALPPSRGQSAAAGCAGGGRSLDDRPGNDGQPAGCLAAPCAPGAAGRQGPAGLGRGRRGAG